MTPLHLVGYKAFAFQKTFQKTFHFWVQKEGAARRTFKANVKVNVTDFFGVFVVFAVAKCGTNIGLI